ncbi:MAG: holo-ACP synthase [Sphaerochaeta sp.]|nr:holo-ACP synthase [Sphaerochaeta sp.]
MIEGIGIDIVNISRMDTLSTVALHRLFHEMEVTYALTLQEKQRSEYLAGRFAAKEALGKALGTGLSGIAPSDICIETGEKGNPIMKLYGKAKTLVGNREVLVSITHDSPVASAIVLLQERR